MPDRPPAKQLRRIETRLNAILILASLLVTVTLWVVFIDGVLPAAFLLLILPSVVVVLAVALVLGSWLTPTSGSIDRATEGES